ncbi:hypothetical protein [Mycolicibacterium sp. GF69]|uniref:hypothetical protein n=1 Tax=Mycolicibacterium sp. GF69 TaxID=2267251 RepID=UPI00197C6E00|nr:hypothetical protein [Mycolicibacterium sp. GF69]
MARHTARRIAYMKAVCGVIGGAAVVAMATFGAGVEQSANVTALGKPKMTIGATSTQTTPAKAPAVGMAVPQIKGPAPLPSEEQAAK